MTTAEPVVEKSREDTPAEAPEFRRASFIETMLLVILAQQDCLLARARVEPQELQQAVVTKFAQAGVELPEGLTIA